MNLKIEADRIARAIYENDYNSAYAEFKEYFDCVRGELPTTEEITNDILELKERGASESRIANREKYWHDYISDMCGAKKRGFLAGYTLSRLESYNRYVSEELKGNLYKDIKKVTKLSELEKLFDKYLK